eukprot:661742-Pleurochrysis_carterae.AAC.2
MALVACALGLHSLASAGEELLLHLEQFLGGEVRLLRLPLPLDLGAQRVDAREQAGRAAVSAPAVRDLRERALRGICVRVYGRASARLRRLVACELPARCRRLISTRP